MQAHPGASRGHVAPLGASKGAPLERRSDFWTHYCTHFGACCGHFSDVSAWFKPMYLERRVCEHFCAWIGLPKCSRAGKYRSELDVTVVAAGSLWGRAWSRNRVHYGSLGKLFWAAEEGRNLGLKKHVLESHSEGGRDPQEGGDDACPLKHPRSHNPNI